jgi:predicted ATPase
MPPTGSPTFLFAQIEGGLLLWDRQPAAMADRVAQLDRLLARAAAAHEGYLFQTTGDTRSLAFPSAAGGIAAAVAWAQDLAAAGWDLPDPTTGVALRVQMALHTGPAEVRYREYYGPYTLNRLGRLLAAAHGGQILVSAATVAALGTDPLPPGVALQNLGLHHLRDLLRAEPIYQVVAPGLPAAFPPLRSLDPVPNNLPAPPSSIIGREVDTASVAALLAGPEARLVTLTGPGGTGKTRLSQQVGRALFDHFPDGVWWVELATISERALVTSSIAGVLGIYASAGQSLIELLKTYLADKRLLLILDNFEQVVSAAPLIGDLLAVAPEVKALVSSRVVLRVRGERVYLVRPLPAPDPQAQQPLAQLAQYAAVQLFVARAGAARPDFALTAENAPAVAAICARLDGLPLAIELAAARARLLPPAAILTRLDQRLKLLTGGPQDRTARQQTLRGAIAWSYDLLDPDEQILFQRLAVFVGGCTADAVAFIQRRLPAPGQTDPAAAAQDLDAMAAKSLLQCEGPAGQATRYQMLETIREYAAEQLRAGPAEDEVRTAHAIWALALAEHAAPELRGPDQISWLDQLEFEHDNLRAALAWATHRRLTQLRLRLATALVGFWEMRGHWHEGRDQLDEALTVAPPATPARGWALLAAGALAEAAGDSMPLEGLGREALAIFTAEGDSAGQAGALYLQGQAAMRRYDYAAGRALFSQALARYRAAHNRRATADTQYQLGRAVFWMADYDAAGRLLEEALVLARQAGDRRLMAQTLHALAQVADARHDSTAEQARLEQALALWRALDDRGGISWALGDLGSVLMGRGEYEQAEELLREAVELAREAGDGQTLCSTLIASAEAARCLGDLPKAARCAGEATRLAVQGGWLRSRAYALRSLAHIALQQDQPDEALRHLRAGLALAGNMGPAQEAYRAGGLVAGAGVLAAQGDPRRAARLLSAVAAWEQAAQSPLWPADRQAARRIREAVAAALGAAAFAAAWEAGQRVALDTAVAELLETDREAPA